MISKRNTKIESIFVRPVESKSLSSFLNLNLHNNDFKRITQLNLQYSHLILKMRSIHRFSTVLVSHIRNCFPLMANLVSIYEK